MTQVSFALRGQSNRSLDVNPGTTVAALVQSQGLDPATLQILVDGQVADNNRVLQGGETVFAAQASPAPAAQPAAEQMHAVRVGKFPGKPQDLDVSPGTTVGQVLEAARLDARGYDVRRNGQPVDMNAIVQDGDAIALYRPVQGNQPSAEAEPESQVIVHLVQGR